MDDHAKKWLSKACNFSILTILAGVIWELVHPIYIAVVSALGQAGNFLVNLFYSSAAKISTPVFISFFASALMGIFLAPLFRPIRHLLTRKVNESNDKEKNETTKSKTLDRKLKYTSMILVFIGVLYTGIIFVYFILPYQRKNYFDYKMTILQAVISPEQAKNFNARWCLMRSKKDYCKLMGDIKAIEEKQKEKLDHLATGEKK